ncbi:IS1380 family transposase [bacterium]|nr:IS1380 family transposase [bacterium]
MNPKIRHQLSQRKRQLSKRIDKRSGFSESRIRCGSTKYELSDKQQGVDCGGLGMITQIVKRLDLRHWLNRAAQVFKLRGPYDETDHILNIAFNLLSGGTCLEHLELRRNDEAYLDALGARRIPDPTTAGDFCRRYSGMQLIMIQNAINKVRQRVWKQQPDEFLEQATIDGDGSMVETYGEKKKGIGLNYKGQWGYHPLIISLAQTQEPLYLVNRSGSRPSSENAAFFYDLAIKHCRQAGFRKILLRGDTDFSQSTYLDGWNEDSVEFVFGYLASPNLVEMASSLGNDQWKTLQRETRQTDHPRVKRSRHKEEVIIEKEYKNLVLAKESYADFAYSPARAKGTYRMVVVRKEIECFRGQKRLFDGDEVRYLFYITNTDKPARDVIREANQRCNQENTISQLKACRAISAPLDNLESNWAYMVFASLAWTLKQWSGLLVRVTGPESHRAKQRKTRQRVIWMEFATYKNSLISIPAQVIRSARQTVFRLLTYRPSVDCLLMLHDHIRRPLKI